MNDPTPETLKELIGTRRGKPGQMQKEIAEALIPILTKYRKQFGTLDQVAGCATVAAGAAISFAVYRPTNAGGYGAGTSRAGLR